MIDDDTLRHIEEARAKLDALWETMSIEDFRRYHAKLFGILVTIEQAFERRFPTEYADWQREFYGEDA
jgi:hypothetical protein